MPPQYELLLTCPLGISSEKLLVDFSPLHDRQPHPNSELEATVDKTWEERLESQPALYNGTKFRYAGCKVVETNGQAQPSAVLLQLGLTDYKSHMGTNLSSEWRQFESAQSDTDAHRWRHLASPLGNAAVVETSDGRIVVLQRGSAVGEFPRCPVFPGGHSEPSEVGIFSHSTQGSGSEAAEEERCKLIVDEMYAGIVREVEEETGAPASSRVHNTRPTAIFRACCALSAHQLLHCYTAAQHAFESTQLLCVSPAELQELAARMPGCHAGGAALYFLSLRTRAREGEQEKDRASQLPVGE
eukprot:jgi/Mesen1/4921/ME000246S04140